MAKKKKIPTVILNQGNTIPEGAIIITATKKKETKPQRAPQEDQPKSIDDPQQVREKRKQEEKSAGERIQKRRMTEDYAYTDKFNTKGPHSRVAEATAKGVRIARRGGGRAYGNNS